MATNLFALNAVNSLMQKSPEGKGDYLRKDFKLFGVVANRRAGHGGKLINAYATSSYDKRKLSDFT
jgi:hypothetical protein